MFMSLSLLGNGKVRKFTEATNTDTTVEGSEFGPGSFSYQGK
jgi:hypothetical protein